MCRYGQEYADSLGLKNVIYTPCDFKAADLDQMGWRNRFDLVFSSITPAMNSLDSLWKSIEMSRGWCFQSNFIKAEDDLADAVLSEVIPDITRLERSPRITYTLVNILWLKGYLPEVTYYTEESFRRENAETLAESILKQAPEAYASDEIRRKMIEALNKRADKDGMVERHSTVTYSWVLWDTRKR